MRTSTGSGGRLTRGERLRYAALVGAVGLALAPGCAKGGGSQTVSAELQSQPGGTSAPASTTTEPAKATTSSKTPLGSAPKRSTTTTDEPASTTTKPSTGSDADLVKQTLLTSKDLPANMYTEKGSVASAGSKMGFGSCGVGLTVSLTASYSGVSYTHTGTTQSEYVSQINAAAESADDASAVVAHLQDPTVQDCVVKQMTSDHPTDKVTTEPYMQPTDADQAVGFVTKLSSSGDSGVYTVMVRKGRFLSLTLVGLKATSDTVFVEKVLDAAVVKLEAVA